MIFSRVKEYAFILSAFLSIWSIAQAQDNYEKWKKQEEQKLQQWKDERDQAFTEFLKKEWKEFQALQGSTTFDVPKPSRLPVATPLSESPKENSTEKRVIVRDVEIPKTTPPAETVKMPNPDLKDNQENVDLSFFEATIPISYDRAIKSKPDGSLDEKYISSFWEMLSKSDYQSLLKQTQFYRDRMKLNDWGYCVLLNSIAGRIFAEAHNECKMFVWFMLAKSGYQAKVGYNGDKISFLLPTSHKLYNLPYYILGKSRLRFYAVIFDPAEKPAVESIKSYDQDYPDATKAIEFAIGNPPNIKNITGTKKLKFSYIGEEHVLTVQFNKSDVEFFEWYPQTDFTLYFNASPSEAAATSLLTQLKPFVQGKTETEAVNLLLRFVQTAFAYKTDQEQFGREKPFYPDETLYYPFSDCEDRAVLFAYITRKLLGLDVIGLNYPNHVAAAVKFNSDVGGDNLIYQGKTYTICDPTYENAQYGMCMPDFRNIMPDVIQIID